MIDRITNVEITDGALAFAKPVLGEGAVIGWWSGGITSAVACRLAIEKYPNVRLVYIETGSHHPDGKFGKDPRCKECQKKIFKEYQKKNKEYFARHSQEYRDRNGNTHKERARDSKYKMTYGITVEDYNSMFKEQEGKCLICKGTDSFSRSKHLHVDHCHKTGKIRGLLCNRCNQGIGAFNDDIKLLEVAITYLKESTYNKMIEA